MNLVDKNCHHFDLMNWWLGARPKRVSAFGSNAVNRVISYPNQVHDHATASWEYANGAKGTLHLSLFAHELNHMDADGESGDLDWCQLEMPGPGKGKGKGKGKGGKGKGYGGGRGSPGGRWD